MTTEFAERLDNLLGTLSWTRSELAEKCGITKPTVYRWKSHNGKPSSRSIDKIVLATGVSKDWLVSGTGPMFSGCADDKDQVFGVHPALSPQVDRQQDGQQHHFLGYIKHTDQLA